MNGNDRYNDSPRRSRRPDPLTDPLSDPWPVRGTVEKRREEAQRTGYDGRGYRDEYGGGHRRRAAPPPDDNGFWEKTPAPEPPGRSGPSIGEPLEEDRPRGRRRRPGPADTGSFRVPSDFEALQERPRGRRRKPEGEAAPPNSLTPRDGFKEFQEFSPRRRSGTVESGSGITGRTPVRDLTDAGQGSSSRSSGSHPIAPVERSDRSYRPDAGQGSSPRSSGSHRIAPVERPDRSQDPDPGSDDDADAFALPFVDDDEDEERPRRSRREESGRGGGGRGGSRRSGDRRSGGKRKRKRRKSKAALVGSLLVLTLLIGTTGVGGYALLRAYVIPPDHSGPGTGQVEVIIEAGDSGTAIAQKLEAAGVIASVRAFTNEIRFSKVNFTPGTYLLRERMSAEAAVEMLLDPNTRIGIRVTIREGLRASTILEELAEQTEIPLEEFQAAYADPGALDLPDYAVQGPEGYLYPETYDFELESSAADMLKQMVNQYKRVASETELEKHARNAGLDPNEVMSIAAIVQAETGSVQDMGKISRVVYNRLEIDMTLGMDSTCFYVLEEYGIALNNSQLQRCEESDSEYKTYYRKGLPVGPIVSPGRDAIEAALEPEEGEWLFFVATDPANGITEFAETEAEFLELVAKFNNSQQN